MSMREKSLHRRRVNREHNSNFRAGYVHINEEHLHKAGLRGRKKCFFIMAIVLLALLVISNLLVSQLSEDYELRSFSPQQHILMSLHS